MTIRARKVIRSDSACLSADVLTPTERFAERAQRKLAGRVTPIRTELPRWGDGLRWGDVPRIRDVLLRVIGA